MGKAFCADLGAALSVRSLISNTLSDKNSSDKSVEISALCRKFCPTKHLVRFCPTFQYKLLSFCDILQKSSRIFGVAIPDLKSISVPLVKSTEKTFFFSSGQKPKSDRSGDQKQTIS